MDLDKEQRTVNLALGTYRDMTLRALRETRSHVGAALNAVEASNWPKVADASRDSVKAAAEAAACAGLLYGAGIVADTLARWQDGTPSR